MKVIKPTVITDAMLTHDTVPETDFPAWVSGTTYAVGDKCIRTSTHRIYQRLVAGAGTTAPESDTTNWEDVGPTNKWAMFDNVVGTATTTTSPLTRVINPGSATGLALLELIGRQAQVVMKDQTGGTTVYSKTIDLDGTIIESVYDWFFAEYEQLTDVVLTDLPGQFPNGELTITVTATSGNVSCGVCKPGTVIEIGDTLAGAKAGIVDFSGKERDTFGNYSVVERSFAKEASFAVLTQKSDFNKIFRRLASLRATPAIYIGTEMTGYEPLIVYGFYKDFSIDVAYQSHHLCSLEVEGLI